MFLDNYQVAKLANLPKLHEPGNDWHSPLKTNNVLWIQHKLRRHLTNPVLMHYLKVWNALKHKALLCSAHTPLQLLLYNRGFPPGIKDPNAFTQWSQRDMLSVHKLTKHGDIINFPSLQEELNLPRMEIFCYLQNKTLFPNCDCKQGHESPK